MDHARYVEALAREGAALGDVEIVDIDVPTCPEWNLPALFRHVGRVHRWQAAQVTADAPDQLVTVDLAIPDDDEELGAWYDEGLAALAETLARCDPDRPTPTWFGPRPATFWARRAAHETAIHRWDAEAAAGGPDPIARDQAIDALDELLDVLAPARLAQAGGWPGDATSIHLHATDGDGEWLIRVDPAGIQVTNEHAKGAVAARASASDLLLMMAGRIPPARLELFGDAGVLDRWHRSVAL